MNSAVEQYGNKVSVVKGEEATGNNIEGRNFTCLVAEFAAVFYR